MNSDLNKKFCKHEYGREIYSLNAPNKKMIWCTYCGAIKSKDGWHLPEYISEVINSDSSQSTKPEIKENLSMDSQECCEPTIPIAFVSNSEKSGQEKCDHVDSSGYSLINKVGVCMYCHKKISDKPSPSTCEHCLKGVRTDYEGAEVKDYDCIHCDGTGLSQCECPIPKIDHNDTSRIHGSICSNCNQMINIFRDSNKIEPSPSISKEQEVKNLANLISIEAGAQGYINCLQIAELVIRLGYRKVGG